MNEILKERAVRLAQLSAAIRTGLAEAETILPGINDQLSKLAAVGMTDFQIEGPVIYCRPAGVSSECTDEFVIYQAAIVTLGGIGATVLPSGILTTTPSTQAASTASRPISRQGSCLMTSAPRSSRRCS